MNQNVNLDLIPKFAVFGNLYFSQYDVGRTATINLLNGTEAYTIPVGATVKIQATKPSGLGFNESCTFSGNVVTVVSTETMTDEAGRIPCELRIEYNGEVLGTANFLFNVERSPHPEGTTDGTAESVVNEITALVLESEGYATGTQNGVPVTSGSPYYENNAKYYAERGISDEVKDALLSCFENVAWATANGQTAYNNLVNAFNYVAVTGVSLNQSSLSMSTGETATLVPTITPSNATDTSVTYSSSNTNIATVDQSGVVTAIADGTTTITCTTNDGGYIATCSVAVEAVPVMYSITNNLTNVTSNNQTASILSGEAYNAVLSANAGMVISSVSVTMGGINVTSSVYAGGSITIASVEGDIVITASAMQEGVYNDPTKWTDGYVNGTNGTINTTTANGVKYYNQYIPVSGKDYVYLYVSDENWTTKWGGTGFYSANDGTGFISRIILGSDGDGLTGKAGFEAFGENILLFAVPSGSAYALAGCRNLTDYYTDASVWLSEPSVMQTDTLDNTLWRTGYLQAAVAGVRIKTTASNNEMYIKRAVKVKPNTTYRFSNSDSNWTSDWVGWYLISESYEYSSRITGAANSGYIDITTGADTGWLWISSRNMTDYYETATLTEVE